MRKLAVCIMTVALLLAPLGIAMADSQQDLAKVAEQDANFNAAGYPIVHESVEKTVMLRRPANISTPENMETLKYIAELTNIDINWIVVGADGWDERVNLMFASSDLPDILMKGGIKNLSRVVEDGQLIAVDELMEAYSTGLKPLLEAYPGVDAASRSADGKLYAIPGVNTLSANLTSHRNLWINQTWLDHLGLNMPTTTGEFLDVLRAFRDQDADGDGDTGNEIPYAVEDSAVLHNAKPDIIAGLFGLYSNFGSDAYGHANVQLVDGKVSFLKTDDLWKQVLEYMNIMYTEGLLDNEVFTQTGDMSIGKISSGNVGVFGLSSDDLFTTVSENYVALAPVTSDSGLNPVIGLSSNSMGAAAFITSADESPWVSFRLIDYFFTYEGSMTVGCFNEDLIGITCQQYEDGSWDYTDEMLGDERGVAVAVGEACPLPGGGFGYWRHEENSNYIYSSKVQENVPVWEPYYQKTPVYATPQFDSATADRITEIISDLDIYLDECQAKFITGEMGFDKWDEYVNTTVSLGADELIGYYQNYYDSLVK